MAAPTTEKEGQRRLAALERTKREGQPNGSITEAAAILRIKPSALSRWLLNQGVKVGNEPRQTRESCIAELKALTEKLGRIPARDEWRSVSPNGRAWRTHWHSYEAFIKEAGVMRPDIGEQERQRYRDQIKRLTDEVRIANRKLNDTEDFRAQVFGLVSQRIEPPSWTYRPIKAQGGPGTPILFTSDFQWGEVIRSAELGGVNSFDRHVASRRYKLLIDKTVMLSYEHMVNPKYDGLIYLRGGDMISGEIHDDLTQTNDLQAIPAVKDVVEHECAGIELLLKKFGRIHLINVPGNHGRMTVKPHSKGYAERNFDTLTAWWLESIWKKEPRITFQTPESGDALFKVYGYQCLLTHGDRIGSRGGQGFIGAVATITRGMKKVADYYASLGVSIDWQFIGHFHEAMEMSYGFANGSLPGLSEFARDMRVVVQPPKQWLLFAHPDHGITARWPVLLEPKPRLQQGLEQHALRAA